MSHTEIENPYKRAKFFLSESKIRECIETLESLIAANQGVFIFDSQRTALEHELKLLSNRFNSIERSKNSIEIKEIRQNNLVLSILIFIDIIEKEIFNFNNNQNSSLFMNENRGSLSFEIEADFDFYDEKTQQDFKDTITNILRLNTNDFIYRKIIQGEAVVDIEMPIVKVKQLKSLVKLGLISGIKDSVSLYNAGYEKYTNLYLQGGLNLNSVGFTFVELKNKTFDKKDLRWADFKNTDLIGINLSGTNLEGANFQGADLRRADLKRANLSGADLRRADLKRANLSGADLRKANLNWAHIDEAELIETHLEEANLSGAHLKGADLSCAYLKEANLKETNLSCARLSGADLSDSNLEKANLNEAALLGAHLEGSDLSCANLISAHLSGADLSGANFSKTNLSGAYLLGTCLRGIDLSDAILSGVDLSGADLSESDLSGADLSGILFSGACLEKAILFRANLKRSVMNDALLKESNLKGANLSLANLSGADLSGGHLSGADLSGANLTKANLTGANLTGAYLSKADLSEANLSHVDLSRADMSRVNLERATLKGATLINVLLNHSLLINTDLSEVKLTHVDIYGIAAWDINLKDSIQKDLNITKPGEPGITVDNIEVAQFIHMMLNNEKIREVIDTISSKAVLILGRFNEERKAVLDAIKDELRKRKFLPILFDFNVPASKDITETVTTLAKMSRFIIADITDAKSIPQELSLIVPTNPSVAVMPIILDSQKEYAMFSFFKNFPWVLPLYEYPSKEALLSSLIENVIEPAEQKVKELREKS